MGKIAKITILVLLSPVLWPFYLLSIVLWLLELLSLNIWLFLIIDRKHQPSTTYWHYEDEDTRKKKKIKKCIILALLAPVLWPFYIVVLGLKLIEELLFTLYLYTASKNSLYKRHTKLFEQQCNTKNSDGYDKIRERMYRLDNRMSVLSNREYARTHPNPGPGRHREHGWYLDNDD